MVAGEVAVAVVVAVGAAVVDAALFAVVVGVRVGVAGVVAVGDAGGVAGAGRVVVEVAVGVGVVVVVAVAVGVVGVLTSNQRRIAMMEAGQSVIVRTVTYHYTGRIAEVTDRWITLDDAAWIADSGRWADALRDGTLSEVEPYPGQVMISTGAVVDISPWLHPLPRTQK